MDPAPSDVSLHQPCIIFFWATFMVAFYFMQLGSKNHQPLLFYRKQYVFLMYMLLEYIG